MMGQQMARSAGPYAAENITAPTTAVQIGQPVVDAGLQAKNCAVCLVRFSARRTHCP